MDIPAHCLFMLYKFSDHRSHVRRIVRGDALNFFANLVSLCDTDHCLGQVEAGVGSFQWLKSYDKLLLNPLVIDPVCCDT